MKIVNNILLRNIRYLITKIVLKDNIYPSNINLAANYIYTQDIEGDYLEFGCFRGESFIDAYLNINKAEKYWLSDKRKKKAFTNNLHNLDFYNKNYNRKFLGFDSFSGLPKPSHIDKDHHLFKEGRYDCSKEEFIKIIKDAKVDINRVQLVEGFYKDTLSDQLKLSLKIEKAAIIMIDCDLKESTSIALNFAKQSLQEGTIIIFDDFNFYKGNVNKGEFGAFEDFKKQNPDIKFRKIFDYGYSGRAFIVTSLI